MGFWDRYFIPIIPIAAIVTSFFFTECPIINDKKNFFISIILIAFFMLFSTCGTRDYLTWNRTRWEVLNNLMTSKDLTAEDIDGGFEFNGLQLYSPHYRPKLGKSWWWINRDKYIVAFGPIPEYSIIQQHTYYQWMPPQNNSIFLLKKNQPCRSEK